MSKLKPWFQGSGWLKKNITSGEGGEVQVVTTDETPEKEESRYPWLKRRT